MTTPFHPDHLRQCLSPLCREAADPLPAMQAYQAFYGLDLHCRHPGIETRLGRVTVDCYEVVMQGWWPAQPRATVLMMHGYYDHMGLYRHAVDWALSMGFAVLACDLPGHGLSSGPRASIDDFAEYQAVLRALFDQARRLDLPRPWHVLGQSTGGAILLDYLLNGEPAPELGETLLLAPLVRPYGWRTSHLTYRLVGPFIKALPRRFSENSGDAEFLTFLQQHDLLQPRELPSRWVGALARWIPMIERAPKSTRRPIIVQGEQDYTVDWRYNLGVLEDKFDRPEVLRLPEARHHLVNETEALRQRYFAFLSDRLA
ncbi:alpha-beta hydrolase superfamily lysophospholipase [Pseudomonas duriflava]|uniref:Alpha-beta hydrolase superfamily lysophospholipase n=1 Tax=Pseudomonas duriflava TaxID=459528 RepID=A0A562Q6D1_9PSED|nr:alpha/beta hydrolase [Pseudomonas duriflava]TWI52289.1 alpha-beta hydrolase superfamily lysophospholipase [Pseudomonas duriflava]